jgi:transposase
LVFIDESSVNTGMTRLYGRSAIGERLNDYVPDSRWQATSILSSLRLNGTTECIVYEGSLTGDFFKVWLKDCLCPTLLKGDIVVMDNLSSHKVSGIKELIVQTGASIEYLPPYSPDLNPVENMWSKVKSFLRKSRERSKETLLKAVGEALKQISHSDALSWFAFCGYYS